MAAVERHGAALPSNATRPLCAIPGAGLPKRVRRARQIDRGYPRRRRLADQAYTSRTRSTKMRKAYADHDGSR